ncbi:hypothetical protein HPB52_006755 [Rhipicephalus sanguineus]|uniref:CCHC-type domain-containing protein n=1 Tax=Rhipicephalus sanguineus TaxID=34632 RepID=A0A9D4PD02_RHISA|nr:hypothetical protein HPB52_006755 [Rhipicephalus sanguineus]
MSRKNRKSSKRRSSKSKNSRSDANPQTKPSEKPTAQVKPCVAESKAPPLVEVNDNVAQALVKNEDTPAVPAKATAYKSPFDGDPDETSNDSSRWPHQRAAWDARQTSGENRQLNGAEESLADRMQRLAASQDVSPSYLGPCYHRHNDQHFQKGLPTRWEEDDDGFLPSLRFGSARTAVGTTALIVPIDGITQVRSLNCIRVSKELETIVPDGIRRVRLNTHLNLLAVDTLRTEVTAALMGLRRLCGVAVEVHEPRSSFKAVGVVYGIPPGMTATDIEAAVRSPVPVLNVRIPHPPSPAIMTFASTQLPEHVDIGFVQHKVHMYVDRPPRCKLCGRIGHVMAVCPNPSPTFSKGTSGASNGDNNSNAHATGRQRCLNCGQEGHDTRSKTCPRWLELIEVSRYRRANDVDTRTARTAVAKSLEARSRGVMDERHHVIKCINSMLANPTSADGASATPRNSAQQGRRVYTVEELLRIGLRTPVHRRPQNSSMGSRGLLVLRTARSAASVFLQRTFTALVRIFVEPVRSFVTTYYERFTKPVGSGLFRPWENQSTADLPFVVKQQKETTDLSG